MNFVKRRKTSSKVDIAGETRKKIEFIFLHDVTSRVEKYDKPFVLIINTNQIPLKYIPAGNETLATLDKHSVTIKSSADKQSITGTFAISFT